jgi:hypothetical protein
MNSGVGHSGFIDARAYDGPITSAGQAPGQPWASLFPMARP